MEAWQEAIEAEGFELRLSKERRFDELSGHLPAQLEGHDVWFECDHFKAEEIIAHYADVDFCEAWKFALAFRIGSSIPSLLAAWIAATAYARATDGVVFDEADGKVYSSDEALELARDLQKDLPRLEAQVKELLARPPKAPTPSSECARVRVWKNEGGV